MPTPASLPETEPPSRSRRSREEVAELLREAARSLFAERGYAGTTTKEIARRAGVSETLLFRYFGGKAALFDEVVSGPFNALMRHFMVLHPAPEARTTREQDSREFVAAVYRLFRSNQDVLGALLAAPAQIADGRPTSLHGLEAYFDQAVARLEQQYVLEGGSSDVDPHIAVRIGFGMIAAPVLLRDWLFPRGLPPEAVMADAIERMMSKALNPRPND
jgi:AcrR family transcriptional regulator